MIQIKIADLSRADHAISIIDLLDQYANHPMGGGEALTEYTRDHLISALRSRTECTVILAYDENEAVGLCNCFEAFSTFASKPLLNIHDLFVKEAYRNQGIGRKMMQKAEQIAKDRGCCKITLEVLSKNKPAKKSYRATGYQAYQLDKQFGFAEFWQKKL